MLRYSRARTAARSPRCGRRGASTLKGTAQVVVVEDQQVNGDHPPRAPSGWTRSRRRPACRAGRWWWRPRSRCGGREERVRPAWNRRSRARSGSSLRRVAVPRQTAPVRWGRNAARRSIQVKATARSAGELARLGVGAEEREVRAHLVLEPLVVGKFGGAHVAAEQTRGATLRGAVFHAVFDHEARCGDGDFFGQGAGHRSILGSATGPAT